MSNDRPRASRRAVRPSGTVGDDESVLRSVLPVAAPGRSRPGASTSATEPTPADPTSRPGEHATPAQRTGPAADDPAVPGRSLDDRDLGWGERVEDSNDDRLRRDKPPHW